MEVNPLPGKSYFAFPASVAFDIYIVTQTKTNKSHLEVFSQQILFNCCSFIGQIVPFDFMLNYFYFVRNKGPTHLASAPGNKD